MSFATIDDVNKFLDESKVLVTDQDEDLDQDSAERLIRGYLASHVPSAELASWRSPGQTPELIRDIAGRLVAAFRYRKLYSEDVNEVSPYAQELYNEAIAMLRGIITGELTIVNMTDVNVDLQQGSGLSSLHFYPNDDAENEPGQQRKFGMGLFGG